MGFKIGKMFKGLAKGIGSIAKGVVKFAKSPLGKLVMQVGLSMVTGGAGGLLAKGLGMLGNMSKLGSLASTFTSVASKFLGPATNFLSQSGLSTVAGFLSKATNTSDLLSMAKDLISARQQAPQTDPTTTLMADENLRQLFAYFQAQQLRGQLAAAS